MKTMNERYDKGWALLREDIAKNGKDNQRWTISLFVAAIVIIPILSNSDTIANIVNLIGN